MNVQKLSFGRNTMYGLRDGYFYLDGGSMFGVVPKVLWEKTYRPDEKNRIKMGLNSLLVQTENTAILIETGIGSEIHPKFKEFYSVQRKPGLLGELQKLGYGSRDIDVVINTHLHFDHCGGNTYQSDQGPFVPTFPRANYIIQKGEWEYALHPCLRDKPSYRSESFLPLQEHGCLQLIEGQVEVADGIEVIPQPGHTLHHQCVKITSGDKTVFFLGDLVPMSAHAGLSYIMSYDLYPMKTLESKKKVYEQAIAEDWILGFVHDPSYYFGKIIKKDNKYIFQPIETTDSTLKS